MLNNWEDPLMTIQNSLRDFSALAAITLALLTCPARSAEADREGLLLEYPFDGNLEDTSGAAHPGKLPGTPVFAPGHEGQCLSLDGSGGCVDSGTNLPSLKDTFTIECWVKPAPCTER